MSIPLYEDFASPLGQFVNYDTYDPAQKAQLASQKHVDLRSFHQSDVMVAFSMFTMDGTPISSLDGVAMSGLDAGALLTPGENWSAGTVTAQSDRNFFNGISLSATTGSNPTSSVITGQLAIDISAFGPTDSISLALPALPLSHLTLASCFLDLSSDPTFATATDSLALSASTSTLIAGDCEARWPLSMLTQADKTKIVAVRLRIQATANCTFRCLAIRCLSAAWEFAPVDQNTLYERLCATVPPSGGLSQAYSFPAASTAWSPLYPSPSLDPSPTLYPRLATPSDWPILMFSDGALGPSLVDTELGLFLNTGSATLANTVTLYLREYPMLPNTMAGLDQMTISQIEALSLAPDFVPGVLDNFAQTWYYAVTLNWGSTTSLNIRDAADLGYHFTPTLAAHTDYYLDVSLEDSSIRVQILPASVSDTIDWAHPVFDSTTVIDPGLIKRRTGRLGWYAHLADGDASIRHLRPRSVTYSEYRSLPLASHTPVEGARLYSASTPNQELLDPSRLTPRAGTRLSPDNTRSDSGACLKLTCDGQELLEGFSSAAIRFENLSQSLIAFDVLSFVPLIGVLIGEGRVIDLYIPPVPSGKWTHVSIPLELIAQTAVPGAYRLAILQTEAQAGAWFIDNLSVQTRNVAWSGRTGMLPAPWQPFRELLNAPYDGVLLGRGNTLQVRGQVLSQLGSIGEVKVLPKYAELGDFVWPEEAPTYLPGPTPAMMVSQFGLSTVYDASGSTAPNGILTYCWQFGDDSFAYGPVVTHRYSAPGAYTVNLIVIDQLGLKASLTQTVTIITALTADAASGLAMHGALTRRALTRSLSATVTSGGSLARSLVLLPSPTLYPSPILYP